MRVGGQPAGSSRLQRLDPFALPVRFSAGDAAADGRLRDIELHQKRVVVRRAVRGVRMALNMPMSAFLGVSLRMLPPQDGEGARVAVVLAHKDPGLTLPLYVSETNGEVLAEWQKWSEALGLPMLSAADDETAPLGEETLNLPRPRRRRRSPLHKRRPLMSMRRRPGRLTALTPIHRDEREIIARN